eukprot:gene31375-37923_t
MLPLRVIAVIVPLTSFIYLLAFPNLPSVLAILPFLVLTTKGVDLTVVSGLFLSAIWIVYTLTLTLPLYYLMGRYFILMVYLPVNGVVFYKEPHDPATDVFLTLQTIFWDSPLLLWIHIMDFFKKRALQPFISDITAEIALGSLPLQSDVEYLAGRDIGVVVNMCREYKGPLSAYAMHEIQQVHVPTPDICEPSFLDMLTGIYKVRKHILSTRSDSSAAKMRNSRRRGVFVHCKAGRGRSAAFTLCLLVSLNIPPAEAMQMICENRKVVEKRVQNFKVVQRFVEELMESKGDFDILYSRYEPALVKSE